MGDPRDRYDYGVQGDQRVRFPGVFRPYSRPPTGVGGFFPNCVFFVIKSGLFFLPRAKLRAAFVRMSGMGRTCGVAGGTPDVTRIALRADFASFLLSFVSVYVSDL